jgi:hypothetical protein
MFHQNMYQTIAQEKQVERKRFIEDATRNQQPAAGPEKSQLAQRLQRFSRLFSRLLAAVPRSYLRNLASNSSWEGTSSPTTYRK